MSNNFNFTESGYTPDSYDFDFGAVPAVSFIYSILSGTNRNFIAIWADPTANINTGKVYASTSGEGASFFIIDLLNKVLYSTYTINNKGAFGESLDQENIVDINVNSAV